MDSAKEYEFKKILRKLSEIRGSGTQLISVYIPAGYPIHEVTNKLREEINQASNIKSKTTRNNVIDALEKIINHLKLFKKTPENGLVIFCGNISQNPSKVDIELFALEPIQKLNTSVYKCDSTFFLDPLKRMMESKDTYGIVVMDGRDATLALLKGTETTILKKLHSTAHAKIKAGGQSSRRFQRLIEENIEKYYKRVGEAMNDFLIHKVKGVIIGGPGPTKEFFYKMKPWNYQLKILGLVDTGYTDEYGVREVIEKGSKFIAEQEAVKEKKLIQRFINDFIHNGLATYGLDEVINAIKTKQAKMVLVSEGLKEEHVVWQCGSCKKRVEKFMENPPETLDCGCGGKMEIIEREPLVEYITDLAQEKGIEVEIISTNTSEGMQFLQGFAGLGAFLRYK